MLASAAMIESDLALPFGMLVLREEVMAGAAGFVLLAVSWVLFDFLCQMA